jgi:hypothetical protein
MTRKVTEHSLKMYRFSDLGSLGLLWIHELDRIY